MKRIARNSINPGDAGERTEIMKGSTPNERAKELRKVLLGLYDPHDPVANIVDMLTDLRHLCDEQNDDFAELDKMAYRHYIEEKASGSLEMHLEA
jgi:hypothetical protein